MNMPAIVCAQYWLAASFMLGFLAVPCWQIVAGCALRRRFMGVGILAAGARALAKRAF